MIHVHPRRAFLNTLVAISNKGDDPVRIKDSLTGEFFSLSSGESKTARFSAGEHELLVTTPFGGIERVKFVVEDALKFGGSERKTCYVFDNNPWAVIVMRDRTYFFNEKTGEQFVEHNLSPESIEELNRDYLLFTTGQELSFFSLRSMSIEETFSGVRRVYTGENHCVLSGEGKLIVYRLSPEVQGDRTLTLECASFIIQEMESRNGCVVRYIHKQTPRAVHTLRLLGSAPDGVYETNGEIIDLDDEFICFPGPHSVLLASRGEDNAPKAIYGVNLCSGIRVDIYGGEDPVSTVNGIKIWDNDDYNNLIDREINSEASDHRLEVFESAGFFCHILTSYKSRTTEWKDFLPSGEIRVKKRVKTLINSVFHGREGEECLKSSLYQLTFKHVGNVDYVSSGGKVCIIKDTCIIQNEGELRCTSYGDAYLLRRVNGSGEYYTLENRRIPFQVNNGRDLRMPPVSISSFGLFYEGDNEKKYYWLRTGREYVGEEVTTFSLDPKPAIVSGGRLAIGPRFFMKNGRVFTVPIPEKDIIALSSGGEAVLYEKGGVFGIARYSAGKWSFKEDLRLSIYDTLHVKDAVFCSDGDSFIYQKGKTLVLYDFESGEETEFDTDKGIQNNVNGYRPYCSKDYFSRPVIVDPVSRRTIDHNYLAQYRFSSIDGSAYFVKRDTRYYLRDGRKPISKDEYAALCREYDYPHTHDRPFDPVYNPLYIDHPDEEISRRRRSFFEKIGSDPDLDSAEGTIPQELSIRPFVDSYVVSEEEVAIINHDGHDVEITIGDPPLQYLNYVAFSADSRRVALSGKYNNASGLCIIYDLESRKELHRSTWQESKGGVGTTMAIWLASFSRNGVVAYYDSTPNTYLVKNDESPLSIKGRSFLTFSPSGRYIALSRQGYVALSSGNPFWGHVPSCDIFIAGMDAPNTSLCHFNDHGDGIVGTGVRADTVACASFSADEKKILSVSRDGVVVIRNLHLE